MEKAGILFNGNDGQSSQMVDFESQLARVVEQDGVVLNTPAGVKKRARRIKRQVCKTLHEFKAPVNPKDTEAQVEQLDKEAVACFVHLKEPPASRKVGISHQEHERSPFVVSLRECVLDEYEEDRLDVNKQLLSDADLMSDQANAGLFTKNSLKSEAKPWMAKEQMTHKKTGTLTAAFKRVHGELKFALRDSRQAVQYFWSRLKKQEKRFEEDIEEGFEQAVSSPPAFSFARAALGFVALAIVMTLPAQAFVLYRNLSDQKDVIQSQGSQAVAALSDAAMSGDLAVSVDNLSRASEKFKAAEKLLDDSRLMAMGAAAVVPSKYQSARALLEVGDKMSESAYLLASGFAKVFDDSSRGLIERLEVLGAYAQAALPLLEDAQANMEKVDLDTIPEDYQDQIADLEQQIASSQAAVKEFAVLSEALVGFLGKDDLKTYLLVFQNNAELRPSGGFMGSVAEVRIDRGELKSIYVPPGGTYDLKGQLTERVQSPRPLQLINPLWQFQDANWYADFPQTAEQIRWFWSKSGQPTLDGVIAVNAGFMQEILKVTGPIEMAEYGKTITADNFFLETQKAVELEYDKQENTPKKFIGDLFDALLAKLPEMDKSEWLAMVSAASQGLRNKDIQIAMFDENDAQVVDRFGWNGRLKASQGDSLAIIGANIAGQKTDAVVEERVSHEININSDGTVIDTLILHRKHNGVKGDLFTGVRNVQYLRVYVPQGSRLLAASGFEPPSEDLFKTPLDSDVKDPLLEEIELSAKQGPGTVWQAIEGDRTVFGGWLQLDPGMSQEIRLEYELPFTVRDIMQNLDTSPEVVDMHAKGSYLVLMTSQSGKARKLEQTIKIAEPWKMIWSRSADGAGLLEQQGAGYQWSGDWNQDLVTATLLKQ